MEAYLVDIQKLPSLSDDEVSSLLSQGGGAEVREQIALAHLSLVVRIAFKYAGYGLPMTDLVSEGNLGLLRAAELFDPKYGVAFSTYASVWIKQRMHRAITAQARVVRIPVWRSQRLRKLDRLHEELNVELGRDAEFADLADRLGVSEEDVERMTSDRVQVDALEDVSEAVLMARDIHPMERLSGEELKAEIAACLDGLDDTEMQIIARKFGLLDEEPESYREMAPRFGKSREWIRKIGEGALVKLRNSFTNMGHLPRLLVEARRCKAQGRLKKLARGEARLSLFPMALMQWMEPLHVILCF